MKNKKEKQKDLDELREQLEANKNIFLAGYEKMKVEQDFELRKTVRGAGGHYKVIKNRIAEKAAEGFESGGLLKELKGMCAIAYTSGDPVALAKALTAYAKANPAFVFKAGHGGRPRGGCHRHQSTGYAAVEGRDFLPSCCG